MWKVCKMYKHTVYWPVEVKTENSSELYSIIYYYFNNAN